MSECFAMITSLGEALAAQTIAHGAALEFYEAQVGEGNHEDNWNLAHFRGCTQLISAKNRYKFSKIDVRKSSIDGTDISTVQLKFIASNYDWSSSQSIVNTSYYMREIGIFAREEGTNDTPILFAIAAFKDSASGPIDIMPAYNAILGETQFLEHFALTFNGHITGTISILGAAYLAEDGEALEGRMDSVEGRVTAVETDKVDMTDALINLDTNAAASTVDGKLTAALTALGWLSDVIES